jgi:hypothetical protein
MCVRCKELVCPCTRVLGISVRANEHPPPITSHTYYSSNAVDEGWLRLHPTWMRTVQLHALLKMQACSEHLLSMAPRLSPVVPRRN